MEKQQAVNLFPIKDEEKKDVFKTNLKYIIFYSLSVTIAVSVSNVIISFMETFPKGKEISFKLIYILLLIGITIYVTFVLGERISK